MGDSDQVTEVQKLFVQHITAIKYYVLSLLPNPSEADDIVQEVFLTVTAKAADFESGTNFKAWALAIARFKVLEQLRRDRKTATGLSEELMEKLAEESLETATETSPAMLNALAKCIEKLAPRPRTMIRMQYEDGAKPADIARHIDWEVAAVYVALSRARKALKLCVQKQTRRAGA
ncbi:MAG: sigma-70 family RNA polymerase sigma factor [Verrucomicrobiales bacterium]|nr:sigma-70 family RNA polymerase sigma factor [Verrucomicrobiales bacterium]